MDSLHTSCPRWVLIFITHQCSSSYVHLVYLYTYCSSFSKIPFLHNYIQCLSHPYKGKQHSVQNRFTHLTHLKPKMDPLLHFSIYTSEHCWDQVAPLHSTPLFVIVIQLMILHLPLKPGDMHSVWLEQRGFRCVLSGYRFP